MTSAEIIFFNRVIDQLRQGDFQRLVDEFLPQLQPLVPSALLKGSWDDACRAIGSVVEFGAPELDLDSENEPRTIKVLVTGTAGAFVVVATLADGPALTSLQLLPATSLTAPPPWECPDYVIPDRFHEMDITIGKGPLSLPGTLSLPTSSGLMPAVILLAGSGPCDRDSTLGTIKPLKDIAWALASSNIAVLRFDKTTLAHPHAASANTHFTIEDEYVTDTMTAIELLRDHPSIDPDKVVLAGHSLGGTVAPLVAKRDERLGGIAILAGGSVPLHHAMLRQMRYLSMLNPSTESAAAPALEALQSQVDLIDSAQFDSSTPSTSLPFGVPAPYWLMLRSFDPTSLAATLQCPIFLAQGGRDYQVTVQDDLERWTSSLKDNPNVELHLYPQDNHLFVPGSAPSTPLDYLHGGHVDDALVRDLAAWVHKVAQRS
jgi:dienelactone hydrolase